MRTVILIFFLIVGLSICNAQQSIGVSAGFQYKPATGSTHLGIAYQPSPFVQLYFKPSYGIFYGGTHISTGVKGFLFSKKRFFPHLELGYLHSFRQYVAYENHQSGGVESYMIPAADFAFVGLGLNLRVMEQDTEEVMIIHITGIYNQTFKDQYITYVNGPFSQDGAESSQRKLTSGWGLKIGIYVPFWKSKK